MCSPGKAETVRKILLLAFVLAAVLLAPGCETGYNTEPTTTTAGASTTTTASSTSTTASTEPAMPTTFTAELSGAQVVPAVDTIATGTATITIDGDGARAHFRLTVSNITDVIAARVHEGKPGVNGQGLLILYPGPTQIGSFTGVLAQGNFNASVLIGSLSGESLAHLAVLLQGGQAYVNVGTIKNPKGEIRGQILQQP
jgi:hypothetical protein